MAILTRGEADILGYVRNRASAHPGGVPAFLIRDAVWHDGYGIGYDAANRALRSLVDSGLLTKPRRGYYLPTEED